MLNLIIWCLYTGFLKLLVLFLQMQLIGSALELLLWMIKERYLDIILITSTDSFSISYMDITPQMRWPDFLPIPSVRNIVYDFEVSYHFFFLYYSQTSLAQLLVVLEKYGKLKGTGIWKIPTGILEEVYTLAEFSLQTLSLQSLWSLHSSVSRERIFSQVQWEKWKRKQE